MQSRANLLFPIFITLIVLSQGLHLEESQNLQLKALKDKQQFLKDKLKAIDTYSDNIDSQLSSATSDEERVEILQGALGDEKLTVFDLKNKIIYPFNESQSACKCKQLTDQEKAVILNKIQTTRTQLYNLQQITSRLNQTNLQVQGVNDSIKKELILMDKLQGILNAKCKENLTPTIFQSNLNAKNWILGPQTMSDLQQEYAQRALIFHNITNCPLETPFFSPTSQLCINCQYPNSLFDMYSKNCTICENNEEVDLDQRICRPIPHYTDFTQVQNWNLEGGSLPEINPTLTPCPNFQPYFNGVICVACEIPSYWSVSANLCKQCGVSQTFDLNTKKCQQIKENQLTILQNTKWVSQNLTRVIEERANVLQTNKTTKNYVYCSNLTPYYDGTTCITCDYFDVDMKKCVQKPAGTEYDSNVKRFLLPQPQMQTDPNAQRYISSKKLTDTGLPNCYYPSPYYDGIACIECMWPFDIFNVDQKKCVACNSEQIYVQNLHICQARKKIRISQRFDRLLATTRVTVPQYKQSLANAINDNPDAIIQPCKDKNQYSNLTHCFLCSDKQYFNVQTLRCQSCEGVYYDNNQTCQANVYIFTNLQAPRIVDMGDTTVEKQNNKISEFLKTHPESFVCPLDAPYAIQNKTCGTCPDLFSYSEMICEQCSEWFVYFADARKCVQAKMVVNFNDASKILVSQTQTLYSFKDQQQSVKNQNPNMWKQCPIDRPYTENRDFCFNCTNDSPYFNYTVKQCQACPENYVFDSLLVSCVQQFFVTLINYETQPRMLGYDNYTLAEFMAEQDQFIRAHPFILCNESAPFGTPTGCQQCNQPTAYFDIREKECSDVKYMINFGFVGVNYLLGQGKTIASYQQSEKNFKIYSETLTVQCPPDAPFTSDREKCFTCKDVDYLFNFETKRCESCSQGTQFFYDKKMCLKPVYLTNFNPQSQNKMIGTPEYGISNFMADQDKLRRENTYKDCNPYEPYGTADGCKQCTFPQEYFDIKSKQCTAVKNLINFDAVGYNYILKEGKYLSDYQNEEQNYNSSSGFPTAVCPFATPFTSNRDDCFACTSPYLYFNFQTKACQSCEADQSYDPNTKRCVKVKFYTLLTPATQSKLLQSDNYTLNQYKSDLANIKSQIGSVECPSDRPFAIQNGGMSSCTDCNYTNAQYFNIRTQSCQSCRQFYQYFEDHTCKDNIILTNTKQMIGYFEIDNYTKYNVEKMNNFTYLSNQHVVDCPADTPFYSIDNVCVACNTNSLPIFNLKSRTCIYAQSMKESNPQFMKNYIESGDETMASLTRQISTLTNRGVRIDLCPSDKPYLSHNECIACPDSSKYFDLATEVCTNCGPGQNCIST